MSDLQVPVQPGMKAAYIGGKWRNIPIDAIWSHVHARWEDKRGIGIMFVDGPSPEEEVPPVAHYEDQRLESGATRNPAVLFDPEGFLSPLAVRAFCQYMEKHRTRPDGEVRASDNWQLGIPLDNYMKSIWRHFLDLWLFHRGYQGRDSIEDALCGLLFNIMGYLHELKRAEYEKAQVGSRN